MCVQHSNKANLNHISITFNNISNTTPRHSSIFFQIPPLVKRQAGLGSLEVRPREETLRCSTPRGLRGRLGERAPERRGWRASRASWARPGPRSSSAPAGVTWRLPPQPRFLVPELQSVVPSHPISPPSLHRRPLPCCPRASFPRPLALPRPQVSPQACHLPGPPRPALPGLGPGPAVSLPLPSPSRPSPARAIFSPSSARRPPARRSSPPPARLPARRAAPQPRAPPPPAPRRAPPATFPPRSASCLAIPSCAVEDGCLEKAAKLGGRRRGAEEGAQPRRERAEVSDTAVGSGAARESPGNWGPRVLRVRRGIPCRAPRAGSISAGTSSPLGLHGAWWVPLSEVGCWVVFLVKTLAFG